MTLGGTLIYVGERLADIDFVSRALGITTLNAYTRVDAQSDFPTQPALPALPGQREPARCDVYGGSRIPSPWSVDPRWSEVRHIFLIT